MSDESGNRPWNEPDETPGGEQAGSGAQWSVSKEVAGLREAWQKVECKPLIFLTVILAAGTVVSGILLMINADCPETKGVALSAILIGSCVLLCPSAVGCSTGLIKYLAAYTIFVGIMFILSLWSLDREMLKPIGTYSNISMNILFLAMMVSLLVRYRLVSRGHSAHSDT